MNTAIDNYFNSSYKNMVSFFAKEKYQPKSFRNSGHDRKSERRKIDFTKNNNCVLKKLNDGNTIYLPPKKAA
jgi:hypothetical protein